jgi:DNA-damage-inducible protein J
VLLYQHYVAHLIGAAMPTSTFSVRMDSEVKHQLDEFCAEVGMTTSTAINMFARTVVRDQRLPFEVSTHSLTEQELLKRVGDFAKNQNISTHELIEE